VSTWITGRYWGSLPWLAVFVVLTGTFYVDQHWNAELRELETTAAAGAAEDASAAADALGNAISERVGALAAPRLRYTEVQDSISERAFAAAVDSVTGQLDGLMAISPITLDGRVARPPNALLGRPGPCATAFYGWIAGCRGRRCGSAAS
jgi:hypothetical protein